MRRGPHAGRVARWRASGGQPLVGFDFEFKNGAHKLHKIGIRYAPPNLVPRFADQNTDDPWRVRIKYAKIE
jgi:hypothetical protein